MLVREQPATDLVIATRILGRASALAGERRITLRLKDVMYIGGRGVSLTTMTPYDVAVVLLTDGSTLHGTPPADALGYLEEHRRTDAGSVAQVAAGQYVSAPTLRGCALAALRRARGERTPADEASLETAWLDLVAQARISGALIGAFPTEDEPT